MLLLRIHHFQKLNGGMFDIGIAELMSSAFHGKHGAAMDIFEIAEWKLESRLAVLSMRRIDPEMPLRIFSEAVTVNEIILLLGSWMMISPLVFLIHDYVPVSD